MSIVPDWLTRNWIFTCRHLVLFALRDPNGAVRHGQALFMRKVRFLLEIRRIIFANRQLAQLEVNKALEGKSPHLVDEWQEVPAIWDAVRYSVDQKSESGRYILTGSSTPKIKGVLHSGTGRIASIPMHPMSLWESGESSGIVSLSDVCNGRDIGVQNMECPSVDHGYGPDYQQYYLKGLSSARALLTAICQEVKELVDDINVELSGSGDLWAYVHPRIVDVSKRTFDVEAYAESVEAAFKELNTQVKKRVRGRLKKELDGVQLMQTVFSVENPLLKVEHDIESKSGRDTQLGYMQMLAGAISAIRNPKAHENMVISREDAVRKLMFASMLMYKIEGAEICN